MTIKTKSMNKAAYMTIKSGVMGDVVWEDRRNSIFFDYTEELQELYNHYDKCIEDRGGLEVDLVKFISCRSRYNNIISEDRKLGKHLE